ncbi:Ff.00g011700.m01.CDS01 [Fusarium sp. VM40]|nr:Ff.00g011700.m01.CDS01 [Fusarium sp. VM40]
MSDISDTHAALLWDMQCLDIPTKRLSDSPSETFERSYLSEHSMEVNPTALQELAKRRLPPSTWRIDSREAFEKRSHEQADFRVLRQKSTSGHQLLASETSLQRMTDDQQALHWVNYKIPQQPETGPMGQDKLMEELELIYAGLAKVESNLTTEAHIISPCVEPLVKDSGFSRWSEQSRIETSTLKDDLSQAGIGEGLHTQRSTQDFSGHSQSHNLEFRSFARKISLHCRTWRRISDRLLPLLRREQHLASSQQWVEVMKLSSSLMHLLNENESTVANADTALVGALARVEAILNRLMLRFRCRYDKLEQKVGLVEAIFEFPNNFRHLCTTMPWTIAPALLILWGVCWMFFGSPPPPLQKPTAAGPATSPSPVLDEFLGGDPSTDTSDYLRYFNIPYADGYGSQDNVQSFVHDDLDLSSSFFDPLRITQDTPRDPDFLQVGHLLQTNNFNLEMLDQDSDDTRRLPETTASDTQPQSHQTQYRQSATNISGHESETQW